MKQAYGARMISPWTIYQQSPPPQKPPSPTRLAKIVPKAQTKVVRPEPEPHFVDFSQTVKEIVNDHQKLFLLKCIGKRLDDQNSFQLPPLHNQINSHRPKIKEQSSERSDSPGTPRKSAEKQKERFSLLLLCPFDDSKLKTERIKKSLRQGLILKNGS